MKIPEISNIMTTGGDARIVLDSVTATNKYHSAPYARDILAYASSTANDLSVAAQSYLLQKWQTNLEQLHDPDGYGEFLEKARVRIRRAYRLPASIDIAFAPSGTDLEYLALMSMAAGQQGLANILVGGDEVGSGCVHSAAGAYFASETALGHATAKGDHVARLPDISLTDIPVRCEDGMAFDSATIAAKMLGPVEQAIAEKRHALIHVVHGSKTGLILPHLDEIDVMKARYGDKIGFVVDACQARITSAAIAEYLERGMLVMMTGSKFMGGPPFSGFMLLPQQMVAQAPTVAAGIRNIFRKTELPEGWPGRDKLEHTANAGLALRLDASLFELELFQRHSDETIQSIIHAFVKTGTLLCESLGISLVASAAPVEADDVADHPLEMQTLLTLDLCHDKRGKLIRTLDFDDAVSIHKMLVDAGVRLGQPVRCVRLPDGRWGATLRVGISMPQVNALSACTQDQINDRLNSDMARISNALQSALQSKSAACVTGSQG